MVGDSQAGDGRRAGRVMDELDERQRNNLKALIRGMISNCIATPQTDDFIRGLAYGILLTPLAKLDFTDEVDFQNKSMETGEYYIALLNEAIGNAQPYPLQPSIH